MPPSPRYVVQGPGGQPVGELYDLSPHGLVGLHVEDDELARFLQERGLLTPPRPPFLDAVRTHGPAIHGSYAPRPQVNWFLAPPIEDVAAGLAEAFRAAGAGYEIAPVEEAAKAASART